MRGLQRHERPEHVLVRVRVLVPARPRRARPPRRRPSEVHPIPYTLKHAPPAPAAHGLLLQGTNSAAAPRRRPAAPGRPARGRRPAPEGHRRRRVLRAGRRQVGQAGGRVGAPGVLQRAGLREREVPRARHLRRPRLPHEPRHERAVLDERLPERQVQAAARHGICVISLRLLPEPCGPGGSSQHTPAARSPPAGAAPAGRSTLWAPAHSTRLLQWHEPSGTLLGRAPPQACAAARGAAAGACLSSRRPGAEGAVLRQSSTTLFSLRTCAVAHQYALSQQPAGFQDLHAPRQPCPAFKRHGWTGNCHAAHRHKAQRESVAAAARVALQQRVAQRRVAVQLALAHARLHLRAARVHRMRKGSSTLHSSARPRCSLAPVTSAAGAAARRQGERRQGSWRARVRSRQGRHQVQDDARGRAGGAPVAEPLAGLDALDDAGRAVDAAVPAARATRSGGGDRRARAASSSAAWHGERPIQALLEHSPPAVVSNTGFMCPGAAAARHGERASRAHEQAHSGALCAAAPSWSSKLSCAAGRRRSAGRARTSGQESERRTSAR